MYDLDLKCPDGVWPPSFSGIIVLGITEVIDGEQALWVAFEIENGSDTSIFGSMTTDLDIPDDVKVLNPKVIAAASRAVWQLLREDDPSVFHKKVQEGEVLISGDFRFYTRYAMNLLRIVESSFFWNSIDKIVSYLAGR